jgi:hypothetical protein
MALQEELEEQGKWLFKYRGTIPLIILVIGIVMYVRTELHPETFFLEETPYEIYYEMFCLFLSLIGLGIRVYTVGHTPKKHIRQKYTRTSCGHVEHHWNLQHGATSFVPGQFFYVARSHHDDRKFMVYHCFLFFLLDLL